MARILQSPHNFWRDLSFSHQTSPWSTDNVPFKDEALELAIGGALVVEMQQNSFGSAHVIVSIEFCDR